MNIKFERQPCQVHTGSVTVLANDYDPDGDPLTITMVTAPQHGSATIQGSSILFTPSWNFKGNTSFTYTVSDGKGGSASAAVNVQVNQK